MGSENEKILIPGKIPMIIGIRRSLIYKFMIDNHVSKPLLEEDVVLWMNMPQLSPSWFIDLISYVETNKLVNSIESKNRSKNIKSQRQELYSSVMNKLLQGVNEFSVLEETVIEEEVEFFSQELSLGLEPEELEEDTIAAFIYFDINPFDHSTWMIHSEKCDGISGKNCEEGEFEALVAKELSSFDETMFFKSED